MTKDYQEALAEVNEILKFSSIDLVKKIPYKFKKFIEDNMDNNYKVTLDLDKPLNEQQIKSETKNIMSLIYRDYICTDAEKEKIIKHQKDTMERKEAEKAEKYNPDNLFKSKKKIEPIETVETTDLIVQEKQNIIQKLWSFIRNKLFKRKDF